MRNTAILLSFFVALVAGGIAGAAASLLLGAPRADARAVPAVDAPAADARIELAARIDALVEENRALRERLATLEERAAPPPEPVDEPAAGDDGAGAPDDLDDRVLREEFEALREELRAQLARSGESAMGGASRPEAEGGAAAAAEDERGAATLVEQEELGARIDEDMAKIEGWLGLNEYQADAMRASLLVRYQREAELRRLWAGGADRDFLGQRKEADRASFRADLERFLDPEQLARYWTGMMERGK